MAPLAKLMLMSNMTKDAMCGMLQHSQSAFESACCAGRHRLLRFRYRSGKTLAVLDNGWGLHMTVTIFQVEQSSVVICEHSLHSEHARLW